jgi:hypothetical protein
MNLVAIVEGQGEVQALPTLARRVFHDRGRYDVLVPRPIRCHRDQFLRDTDTRRRLLGLARLKAGDDGAVLVLLDSDDLCAKEAVPILRLEIEQAVRPLRSAFVFAVCEFECWFIAGADSIAENYGIQARPRFEPDPESVRGAKEWLRLNLLPNGVYSPAIDQPALAARFDWSAAMLRSPSLDKLVRELDRLTAPH